MKQKNRTDNPQQNGMTTPHRRRRVGRICCAVCMALLSMLSLSGCDADNEYDISHRCFFTFDTSLHNTSLVRNALNPLASGTFVLVYTTQKSGVTVVNAQLSDGKTTSQDNITTAIEKDYTAYILGTNNGLIIGYSSLGNGLFAFDRQCPNCISDYNRYNYPLHWDNNGQWVKCSQCQRTYDLNNFGVIIHGEKGSKLIRYKAFFDGTRLTVRN